MLSRGGPFPAGPDLLSLAGCENGEMKGVLAALGYHGTGAENALTYVRAPKGKARATPRSAVTRHEADSPFAKLRDLAISR